MRVGGLGVALVLAAAAVVHGQTAPATLPLTARLVFPAGTPGDFAVGAPIPLTLTLENASGQPVATTDGYSATEFFRRLFFIDQQGATTTNKIEEQIHDYSRVFMCLSRG